MAEVDVMEREVDSGSVGKVGDDHGIWVVRTKLITISTQCGETRTRCSSMFVKHNEVRDIIGTASLRKVLDHIISPVNPVRIGKYQAHLLRWMRANQKKKNKDGIAVIIFLTLANCNNFELGSLDVVKIIFGSIIPALEYSLSMCVVGSTFYTVV
jgi:hypothetical protein